jgi:two-component sensor histidine kinase
MNAITPLRFRADGSTLVTEPEDQLAALQAELVRRDRDGARLKADLAEKELLLAELGHRAGNNLQAIIALIRLTARTIADSETRSRVEDLAERVAKIGLIQHLLGEAGHGRGADARFLGELAEAVRATYGADNVELAVAIEPLTLKPSTAVAVGLLVNEAMSNAFKHAFAGVEQPRLELSLRVSGALAELAIQDNGSGPGSAREGSMGVQLMGTLARQLHGTMAIQARGGTRVVVTVPLRTLVTHRKPSRPARRTMPPLGPDRALSAAKSR